jgi:xylan 1,4-beta-xylosidase
MDDHNILLLASGKVDGPHELVSNGKPLGDGFKLVSSDPLFGSRKRRYREQQMQEGGYSHLVFDDTLDPFAEVGHCSVFEGPDSSDWLCCHYFLEGQQLKSDGPVPEYHDSRPQLGIEPLSYKNGQFTMHGPTWTEQVIRWG